MLLHKVDDSMSVRLDQSAESIVSESRQSEVVSIYHTRIVSIVSVVRTAPSDSFSTRCKIVSRSFTEQVTNVTRTLVSFHRQCARGTICVAFVETMFDLYAVSTTGQSGQVDS
jgi:hypothetical protein